MSLENSQNTDTSNTEFTFDADIKQLMHLIVHTFYSNKDIFLRELISNSSDALDKIRYNSLTDDGLKQSTLDLKIDISIDKENKIISIKDTGIGMDKQDIIDNIGTIASSGTKKFLDKLEETKDTNLIGKFGVGFYSAFLVASKVVVKSKKNDEQYIWSSDGSSSFTLDKYTEKTLDRGTEVELHIKDDSLEYLDIGGLKNIVKQHSEYVSFPIRLLVTKTKEVEVEEEDDDEGVDSTTDDKEDNGGVKIEDVNEDKPKTKTIIESYDEWEQLNDQEPIWTRNSENINEEDYMKFYKNLTNNWSNYMESIHFSVEGGINAKGILYIPEKADPDLFQSEKKTSDISLYVKRVFITDDCTELLPNYMNFVKGVVDSDDLPLTVSREVLQKNRMMSIIKKNLVKQVLKMITKLSEDPDKYKIFYDNFSKNIKLGVHEDTTNRQKLAKFLRYSSLNSGGDKISLDNYVENMKEGQPGIYYLTGSSIESIRNSPFLEKITSLGYDVLLLVDPIDEYVTQQLKVYNEQKLLDITKANLDLGNNDEDTEKIEKSSKEFEPLCKKIKEILSNNVDNVIVSNRIVGSPCCLVSAEHGWSANMERIMRAQALGDNNMMQFMASRKTLEINSDHTIIKKLLEMVSKEDNITNLVELLYESSSIDSGFTLKNPSEFTKRIYGLINLGINGLDEDGDEDVPGLKETSTGEEKVAGDTAGVDEELKDDNQTETKVTEGSEETPVSKESGDNKEEDDMENVD